MSFYSVILNTKINGERKKCSSHDPWCTHAPVRAANQCFGFDLDLKQSMLMKEETVGIGFLMERCVSYIFLNRP